MGSNKEGHLDVNLSIEFYSICIKSQDKRKRDGVLEGGLPMIVGPQPLLPLSSSSPMCSCHSVLPTTGPRATGPRDHELKPPKL
jgi:hypothetical protein